MTLDVDGIVQRARLLLRDPRRAWNRIVAAAEPPDALYRDYIAVLAAIPPLFGFIKGSLIGYGTFSGVSVRIGIVEGLASMLLSYGLTLLAVEAFARFIAWLAPRFGGRGGRDAAVRVVGYACTPAFLAGAAVILPGIGPLVYFAGVVYAFWLLYLGAGPGLGIGDARVTGFIGTAVIAGVALGVLAVRLATAFLGPLFPLGGYSFF